ncbi:MAG: flagellar type III secretion system pore protein FliP [Chloroflexi bacterium]|nr:flagellar type III secretion system pore protein FliP [Chloroflexota bacterium]
MSLEVGSNMNVATGIQLMVLLTALSLAPAALITMTAFTRIIIVLSLVRTAIGLPQLPPNQVLLGLTLFLTIFVMAPVWTTINREAIQPYLAGVETEEAALKSAEVPVRDFMFRQVREKDLALFLGLARLPEPRSPADVPTHVLIPSFAMSELKSAFQMGFAIFIPFLVIDLVVSSILMSMGMMLLPPVVISLPFKLLLFVMVDGWFLLAQGLVSSFA